MSTSAAEKVLDLSTVDFGAVARVASRVSIVGVRVRWMRAAVVPVPDEIPADWPKAAFFGINSRLVEKKDSGFVANVTLGVGFQNGLVEGPGPPPPYDPKNPHDIDLAASLDLTYETVGPDEISDDDLGHFCLFNATFNAWPYLREIVHSGSIRLGITPFLLPTFKVPPLATGHAVAADAQATSPSESEE